MLWKGKCHWIGWLKSSLAQFLLCKLPSPNKDIFVSIKLCFGEKVILFTGLALFTFSLEGKRTKRDRNLVFPQSSSNMSKINYLMVVWICLKNRHLDFVWMSLLSESAGEDFCSEWYQCDSVQFSELLLILKWPGHVYLSKLRPSLVKYSIYMSLPSIKKG